MIEAPCAACGTINRIVEADVPAGAKFVTCTSCKSRVPLPIGKTVAGVAGTPKPPAIPAAPMPKVPPPIPAPATGKAATVELADLPVPKRNSPLAAAPESKPAPRSALSAADADLPAPKPPGSPEPPPEPATARATRQGYADLPAPKPKVPIKLPSIIKPPEKLPEPAAPKAPAGVVDLPAPKPAGSVDLPTPKAPAGIVDLPTPRAPAGVVDLPTPRAPAGVVDLPTPKSPAGVVDLPTPKGPAGIVDLPTPKGPAGIVDLPTPKGGIIDLPAPKPGGPGDLPAPKGFFDDLPQPAAPAKPDLPAPKGFFDDLPQPSTASTPSPPAPKGFFDDLPQPAAAAKPELPAPKGFFDDLPQPAQAATPSPPAPKGFFDDLATPGAGPPGNGDMDLSADLGGPLELDTAGAAIDLGMPGPPASDGFSDLELQEPSAPPSPIKIGTPKTPPAKAPARELGPPPAAARAGAAKADLQLDLDDAPPAAAARKQAPRRAQAAAAPAPSPTRRRTRVVLAGVLGLALAGGGGFYAYQRHQRQEVIQAEVKHHLAAARAALTAADAKHWQRAAAEAQAVIANDSKNAAALGIGAEAMIAGALDNGIAGPAQIAHGRKMIADALAAGLTGPELDRAQAVESIAANQPDAAITRLKALIGRAPKDGFLQLYLGWAELAKGDGQAALKALDAAIASGPAVKLAAQYAHGRAKLMLADLAGAKADFAAVLAADKDHVAAQVGLAEARPPSEDLQRQQDLLAILKRKDIKSADPRAVVQAWTLAADVARRAGQLDVARERYHNALALSALDVPALTGLAAVELRDGKLEVAKDLIAKATAQAKTDPAVKLAAAELAIRQGRLGDADPMIQELDTRTPPLPPLLHAQLQIVKGKLLEARGQDDAAVDAYVQGAKDAGDLDLAPTMAAVEKLSALAKKADDAKQPDKAAAYRSRTDQLLAPLVARAQDDPQLAMTLGVAYLEAGDASKAEDLLRRATEMAPDQIEAKVELAKAYAQLGRTDDAIAQLQAALALDKTRDDIALDLARTYETAGRDADAAKAYGELLSAPKVSVAAREHAGKFFARTGDIAKATAQAQPILDADPDNAAGHYLRGEGLLSAGKLDEARRELQTATDADPDPQYLDAQGRAGEASVAATGDTKYGDLALRAYSRAADADPKMFNPFAGQGRIYVARGEWDKAVAPLQAAIKLKPDDPDVMYMLGRVAKNLRQNAVAIEWIRKSVKIKPNADAYYDLATLYYDQNKPRDAEGAFAEATRLGEEAARQGKKVDWLIEAYYWLGRVHMDMHDEPGAKRPWERYMDLHPPAGTPHTDEVSQALATSLKQYP